MFRLYAKYPGQKRFQPIDWSRGIQVVNLIYATLFTESEMIKVQKSLDLPENHHVSFKFRKVKM
jgi:hypothetical protein